MLQDKQCRRKSIPEVLHFSLLFALLSLWDLMCNDEFNSGSSCLNRLDNFGLIILKMLQN